MKKNALIPKRAFARLCLKMLRSQKAFTNDCLSFSLSDKTKIIKENNFSCFQISPLCAARPTGTPVIHKAHRVIAGLSF